MKTTLFIDTSKPQKIVVAVEKNGKRFEKKSASTRANAQLVLPLIEELIKKNNLKLTDFTNIRVVTGPGSFTGLRVGIAIAKTLGTIVKIPVNGVLPSQVKPRYNPSKLD